MLPKSAHFGCRKFDFFGSLGALGIQKGCLGDPLGHPWAGGPWGRLGGHWGPLGGGQFSKRLILGKNRPPKMLKMRQKSLFGIVPKLDPPFFWKTHSRVHENTVLRGLGTPPRTPFWCFFTMREGFFCGYFCAFEKNAFWVFWGAPRFSEFRFWGTLRDFGPKMDEIWALNGWYFCDTFLTKKFQIFFSSYYCPKVLSKKIWSFFLDIWKSFNIYTEPGGGA